MKNICDITNDKRKNICNSGIDKELLSLIDKRVSKN